MTARRRIHAPATHFPRSVARRILERASRGERRVVVVMKNGKPNSVWGYEEYQERTALPQAVKPWESRNRQAGAPDPLGAIEGAPIGPLTRDEFYEE